MGSPWIRTRSEFRQRSHHDWEPLEGSATARRLRTTLWPAEHHLHAIVEEGDGGWTVRISVGGAWRIRSDSPTEAAAKARAMRFVRKHEAEVRARLASAAPAAMHFDSSGQPKHPVTECDSRCFTDQYTGTTQ